MERSIPILSGPSSLGRFARIISHFRNYVRCASVLRVDLLEEQELCEISSGLSESLREQCRDREALLISTRDAIR